MDSLASAVTSRRGLLVYAKGITNADKKKLRADWAALITQEAQAYISPSQRITDKQHCDAIERIAKTLSQKHGPALHGGGMRFGTSQKAFNLYLKYLWRLGKIVEPPHCPIDEIILKAAGLFGSWTASTSRQEYMDWIRWLRMRAKRRGLTLSGWEYDTWWAEYLKRKKR